MSDKYRLDVYLASEYPELSRSYITKLIKDGLVKVNSKVETKPSSKLSETDKVRLTQPKVKIDLKDLNIEVIYEDDDCVVINKPSGVLSHSKGSFNDESTVASWVSKKLTDLEGDRGGIVHRLDRGTSGVMICAKNEKALKWLQKQFSTRKNKKVYYALAKGHFKQEEAIINLPIERNPKKPQTFRVGVNGKEAITQYEVEKSNDLLSLVKLMPQTGRTHQLRVHLSYLDHPILGDIFYGGKAADRMYLHAYTLEVTLPSKERKVFKADLPKEFREKIS